MAEPSQKSPGIERFLNNMTNRSENIRSNKCATCGGDATEFRDDLSRKEYTISGMCQACQNSVFDAPEE